MQVSSTMKMEATHSSLTSVGFERALVHDVISQKTQLNITTVARTSNPTVKIRLLTAEYPQLSTGINRYRIFSFRGRDSSVGIGMSYGLDARSSTPGRGRMFSLLHSVQTDSEAHPAS
jgi:hypothetical protein